jgi:uncharacterized protein (DUF2141 family)
MKALVLAAALAAGPVHAPAADTATLTVKVEHVSPKGGDVSLALYTAANYEDDDHPTLDRTVAAEGNGATVVIAGLKPGVYAIKMMQDINRNGKFDTSFLGLPLEPYGFSNDAKPGLDEPDFARTKFTLVPGTNTMTVTLSDTDGIDVPPRPARRIASR